MYCLTNICYVCLEKSDKSLVNINCSLSVNMDIIHIIGYLPFNLAWLKTKRIILICEECCLRLRETYQFLAMCLGNSALLQGYMDTLNTTSSTDNEAELHVDLSNIHNDINKIKCEIKLEDEDMYTVGPIIEETEDVFVNVDDSFVKEEDAWKREEVDDKEEPPMDNNATESSDNDTDSEISVNSSTHATDSPGFLSTRVHTREKSHKCATCKKCFKQQSVLVTHIRTHTGEKPYKCATCKKCFTQQSVLVTHIRTHTGEKPYKCTTCNKCFTQQSILVRHMRIHTGEKPFKCATCKKCFNRNPNLIRHMRTHTGEKPYECATRNKCFQQHSFVDSYADTYWRGTE